MSDDAGSDARSDAVSDGVTDEEHERIRRRIAREDVEKLLIIGLVLTVIGGVGVWFTKYDAVEFDIVEQFDERTLVLFYGCNGTYRSEVWESESDVEIRLDYRPPSHDQDCLSSFRIELDEPLGDRTVVDHRTGRPALVVPYTG